VLHGSPPRIGTGAEAGVWVCILQHGGRARIHDAAITMPKTLRNFDGIGKSKHDEMLARTNRIVIRMLSNTNVILTAEPQ
jgi:hypothetical protein